MNEALCGEAPEQSLHNALFQVKMHDVVSDDPWVFKNNGTNRRRWIWHGYLHVHTSQSKSIGGRECSYSPAS